MSHPVWVRGLKLDVQQKQYDNLVSHPVWVRGLKPETATITYAGHLVAPRVGAWIETSAGEKAEIRAESHPVWVRGLKL